MHGPGILSSDILTEHQNIPSFSTRMTVDSDTLSAIASLLSSVHLDKGSYNKVHNHNRSLFLFTFDVRKLDQYINKAVIISINCVVF